MRKRKKCVPLQPLSRETASEDEILGTAGLARSILSYKQTREREIATAVRTENFFKNIFEKVWWIEKFALPLQTLFR